MSQLFKNETESVGCDYLCGGFMLCFNVDHAVKPPFFLIARSMDEDQRQVARTESHEFRSVQPPSHHDVSFFQIYVTYVRIGYSYQTIFLCIRVYNIVI